MAPGFSGAIRSRVRAPRPSGVIATVSVFLHEMGQDEPGLNRLIRAAFKLLGLQTYFTAGVKEVRAWTVRAGSTAPQAAGVIHTDFERGFIKAETVAYKDLVSCGSVAAARDKGLYRMEGKEYVVADGDVLSFEAEDPEQTLALAAFLMTYGQFPEVKKVAFTVEGKSKGTLDGRDIQKFWGRVSLRGSPWDVLASPKSRCLRR